MIGEPLRSLLPSLPRGSAARPFRLLGLFVPVPVMDVGKVGMPVGEWCVAVHVGVWLTRGIVRPVLVPMMFVVHVPVAVAQ